MADIWVSGGPWPTPEQRRAQEDREREQEAEKLAGLIADRLHASVLKIPADAAEVLKQFSGWRSHVKISGGDWPFGMETQIMADGGIRLTLITADGRILLERVLSP